MLVDENVYDLFLTQEDMCVSRLGPSSRWHVIHVRLLLVNIPWRLQVCQESQCTTV